MEILRALFAPYRLNKDESSDVEQLLYILKGGDAHEQLKSTQGMLTRLENKSGVLLTHISMMAAVTGVLIAIQSSGAKFGVSALNQRFLAFDFVFYLILALLCVRCQFHVNSGHTKKLDLEILDPKTPPEIMSHRKDQVRMRNRLELDNLFRGEVYYREKLFQFCFVGLYLVTFLLGLVIIFSIFGVDIFERIQSHALQFFDSLGPST